MYYLGAKVKNILLLFMVESIYAITSNFTFYLSPSTISVEVMHDTFGTGSVDYVEF